MSQNHIIYEPCQHTKRDGLYLSEESMKQTGRWTLRDSLTGKKFYIKHCEECDYEEEGA